MKKFLVLLPILFLWFPSVSHAAIVYNSSATCENTLTSCTVSITTSGTERLLIASITSIDTSVTAPTYNGVSMTLLTSLGTGVIGGASSVLYVYYLVNPALGANNLVFTVNTAQNYSILASATSYYGVDQTNPIDVYGSTSGSEPITLSVTTTTDNDWLISSWGYGGNFGRGTVTAGANTTIRQNTDQLDVLGDSNGNQTPPGSYSQTYNNTNPQSSGLIVAAIRPYVTPILSTFNFWQFMDFI